MQQMSRAVVGANAVPAFGIHGLMHRFADRQLALQDLGAEHVQLAKRLRSVLDLAFEALERSQRAGIADLPAAFAVEGRLVEQYLDRVADFGILDALSILDDRQDDPLAFVAGITGELG